MSAYSKLLSCCLVAASFASLPAAEPARSAASREPGLLFYLSGDRGTTADFSAGNRPAPTYEAQITPIADGARAGALQCGDTQLLAYRAPGNIYAQRGTLSFFWRSRYPVGPTPFPVFRVGYADHSSWDMVWLRIDYNGRGFDAFVTDASLARTRVSVPLNPFPGPKEWTHLAFSWDETRGIRFYVNGRLAGQVETTARYDAGLDQFGPHSRIISPYQVQSDYNFVRGGDIDEVRIYDHMLADEAIATLAAPQGAPTVAAAETRSLTDPRARAEWWHRYGFNASTPPPAYAGAALSVRKVEIHDVFDHGRWWWKANDGIRETTWPGVYNRSRLPGRNDYFQLPDWDAYYESGKAVTFTMPREPWNHVEIAGSAWGAMTRDGGAKLFDRPKGLERTVHSLRTPLVGGKITFTNVEKEEPIGELVAYNVVPGREPAAGRSEAFRLAPSPGVESAAQPILDFIRGRYFADERDVLVAVSGNANAAAAPATASNRPALPLVHIVVPTLPEGEALDGVALDLPALSVRPTHGALFPLNVQVKDPLWPNRNLLDFTFSVRPGEAKTLWFDLRDRILPAGKPLWISVAGAGNDFSSAALVNARLRLVYKSREVARAEHELDRFTQLRDSYAMLVEERPNNPRLDLWNRFKGDLDDLLQVNPQHVLARQYAGAAARGSDGPPYTHPTPAAGVPLWAARQVELLSWVKKFVLFYIDKRQGASTYGDFGGGISDDVDLTNIWPGVALMGVEPDKIRASLVALLDAAYKNGMVTNGLPTIQADELHSYEEGINVLAQVLLVDAGSPRQLERAMETSRGIQGVTGVNAAGHRHFRSSYYSGTVVATEDPWGWTKPYSNLVLQVPQALVDYNGSAAARKYLVELADGMLAHRRTGANGRATLANAIHFESDREGSTGRGTFPWHLYWGPWRWTGERRYLDPIYDGGNTSLMQVNANVLDLLNLRAEIAATISPANNAAADTRPGGGVTAFRSSSTQHFSWQLNGDKSALQKLYESQIETAANLHYINTEGSLWIDRVSVPTAELQRARLGGVALVRNSLYPGHLVSWEFVSPASAQSIALLIPNGTPSAFKVIAYNLETSAERARLIGANLDPGLWEYTQGTDANDDDVADGPTETRTANLGRDQGVELTLAARTTTILTFKLRTPATPYWQRPDLGIEREDITITNREVRVRVHSLGGVASPPSTVAVRHRNGRILATAPVGTLAAPHDLAPKTVEVVVQLPSPGFSPPRGISVEIDPDRQIEEITEANNTVKF